MNSPKNSNSITKITPYADRYLTLREAAEFSGYKEATLHRFNCCGGGPKAYKTPSGSIRYKLSELTGWIESGCSAPE